jgi:hypothetical protein
MKRDDIERTLRAMGRIEVPPADELTVARIEHQWRHAVQGSRRPGHVIAGPAGPARRRSAVFATAGVLAAAAAASAVIAFNLDRESSDRVVVADAEDIVIVLPGGRFVDPQPGETLPEGAFVQAGPYADGRIGDRLVQPDDLFIVADGRLQEAQVEELARMVAPGPTRSSAPTSAPSRRSSSRSEVTTPLVPLPEEPSQDAATPPAATEPPATQATAPPAASTAGEASTTAVAPATTSGDESTGVRRALRVSAREDGDAVVVSWERADGVRVKRYLVYRVITWNGVQPGNGRIASVAAGRATRIVDTEPEVGTIYVVVAVDGAGHVVAAGSTRSPYSGRGETSAQPSPIITEPAITDPGDTV